MLTDIHGPNLTIRGAPTTEEDERSLVNSLDDTPAFQPVMDLNDNDCRGLIHSSHRGMRVGRGAEAEVRLSPHPAYVIKAMAEGHEPSLAKEAARLCRLPRFHFFPQIYAATWDRCLTPRFRRLPFELLTQEHLPKLFGDVSAALRVLHANNIVHADVHLDNIMLRPWPPGFVLIDLASCTGESVYPLELGFGVPGKGGAMFTPPHEQLRPPMRTPAGDFYRFAKSLQKLPSKRRQLGDLARAPRHIRKEIEYWLERSAHPLPPRPKSILPGSSWRNSSQDCVVVVNAWLWERQGDVVDTTAICTKDSDRFGNRDGEFAPEADGEDDVGTWERSAISARFFLVGKLRTKSSTYRHIFEEVHPFRTYGNDDGYLRAVTPQPPRETLQGVWRDPPSTASAGTSDAPHPG